MWPSWAAVLYMQVRIFIFILFVCLNVTSILFKGIKKKCGNVLILFFYEMGKIPHRKLLINLRQRSLLNKIVYYVVSNLQSTFIVFCQLMHCSRNTLVRCIVYMTLYVLLLFLKIISNCIWRTVKHMLIWKWLLIWVLLSSRLWLCSPSYIQLENHRQIRYL
jgi:hypothetical protein